MHENQNEIAVCNFRDVHFPMKTTHWGAQLCTLTVHLVEQLTYFCDWQYKGQERWKAWTSDTTATCTGRCAGCITGLGSFLLALHSTTETVTTWMWACAGEQLNTLSVLAGLYLHPKPKKKLLKKLNGHSLNIHFFSLFTCPGLQKPCRNTLEICRWRMGLSPAYPRNVTKSSETQTPIN